jgi:group I intron endonuclease
MDILKPEYNILKVAGSSYGFKHSIETIERMRIARLGSRHSIETIERIRMANIGRKHSESTKLKLSANSQAHPLRAINNKTGEIKNFTSIGQAAKFIGIQYCSLYTYIRKNKFYRGKGYFITRI